MQAFRLLFRAGGWAVLSLAAATAGAAGASGYPAPKEGNWVARDFRFHDGERLPELRIHYLTIGDPAGEPVVVLHGTAGSAARMLTPSFAGELFGPGQPLDASRYFIILPDAIGAGASSKPSDGMRTAFPKYNYDDMVDAQHRLLTEHFGLRHVRAIIGNSMGGMHAWMWGTQHPRFADILVPMASQPTEMASRNWMMRRLIIDAIRNDPDWKNGQYTTQPRSAHFASVFFGIATSGGNLAYQKAAPTREKADQLLDKRLKATDGTGDANDILYQWESSRDYNPSAGLERIESAVLAINAADDERNPPETGLMEREMKRVKHGRYYLIPASEETTGHATTANARFYRQPLADILRSAPRLGQQD
ncbi:alpha/beta fold hydrolase [Noviherbaspirillum galbum]|uniref:Alpha/beta fold hydrolase n=1 Tax=Noviherbaspirillum galbum TaxID=2709383 RepID=A0A6B3SQM0_9BURK|nr:alpha/beta fold hydrolase [Noviherbaspirillum galbum]NEX63053.1 alpha/beta fold hydrolase [Noviherbaspirillum galbum]